MTRLLLVDDDEDNLKLFTIILENFHFTVNAYSDPDMALVEFKADYYDLLILDYRMPQINGLQLYKKFKEIDNSTNIMILTASHEQLNIHYNQEFQEPLDCKIVRKPVTIPKLLEEINSVLLAKEKPPYLSVKS